MGFGDDWKKALDKVKNTYVEPGKQTELAHKYILQAIEFLDQHDLVTIPPLARETWRMRMISPQQQLVPFLSRWEVLEVAYPANTMSYDQRLTAFRQTTSPCRMRQSFTKCCPDTSSKASWKHATAPTVWHLEAHHF